MHSATKSLMAGLVAGALLVGSQASAETWTDASGQFKIDAKFVTARDGKVTLEKSDGSQIAVPFSRLSPESQTLAKQLYAKMKAGGTTPAAPVGVAAGAGGSKFPANPTAQQTVEVMQQAMIDADLDTMWDALPKRYQSDVEEIVRTAANNIDPKFWNNVGGIVNKVSQVVSTKRDFILNNETVKGFIPSTPETLAGWDATAKVIDSIASSAVTNNAKMKNFTMANFLATDGVKIKAAIQAASKLSEDAEPGSPFAQEPPSFKLISEDGSTATVEIKQNGQTKTEQLVKVDNRWFFQNVADTWDEEMAKAREGLAQLKTPEVQQQMAQSQMMMGMMVSAPLDGMINASSQSEFDQVFDPIVQMVQGFAMQAMGGGGPGGGAFGGPGGPGGGPPPGFGAPPPGFGDQPGAQAAPGKGGDAFGGGLQN